MNMNKKHDYLDTTVAETLASAHLSLNRGLIGLWGIVSSGRRGFRLEDGDLREYVFLYVFTLVANGAVIINSADDALHYHVRVDRYGFKPEEIAHNVTAEWIDQGEPNLPA